MNTHPEVYLRTNKHYIFDTDNTRGYEKIEGYDGYLDVMDSNFKKVGEIHTELLNYLKSKEKIFSPSFLIEEIDDAVILVDPNGRIFFANNRYAEALGIEVRKIIGKHIQKTELGVQIINVLKDKKQYYNPKIHIQSINKYVSLKIRPFYINDEICGVYSIFRDVTEINQLTNSDTLFLDEIGNMSFSMQTKLENEEIENSISRRNKPIDIRMISTPNQSLEKRMFKSDLYYRFNVVSIKIPTLREYDSIYLANYFLGVYNKKYGKNLRISTEVYKVILNSQWTGNVRELKKFIEHGVILASGEQITMEDIPQSSNYVYRNQKKQERVDDNSTETLI